MSLIYTTIALILSFLAGYKVLKTLGLDTANSWKFSFISGSLILYLFLISLTIFKIEWNRIYILSFLLLLVILPTTSIKFIKQTSLNKKVIIFAITSILLTTLSVSGIAVASDYIFQWGIKGYKFALAKKIDWNFLKERAYLIHPDYPLLYPVLMAAYTTVAGDLSPHHHLLINLPFIATIYSLFLTLNINAFISLSLFLLTTLLAPRWSGHPDLAIAAYTLSVIYLLNTKVDKKDIILGVVIFSLIQTKIEGIAIALFTTVYYFLNEKRFLKIATSFIVSFMLWFLPVLHFELWNKENTSIFSLNKLIQSLHLVIQVAISSWYGGGIIIILAIFFLLKSPNRGTSILFMQLIFILYVYSSAPQELNLLIPTSFTRLIFQLTPSILWLLFFKPIGYEEKEIYKNR